MDKVMYNKSKIITIINIITAISKIIQFKKKKENHIKILGLFNIEIQNYRLKP